MTNTEILKAIQDELSKLQLDPRHACFSCDRRLIVEPMAFALRDGKWEVASYKFDTDDLRGWARIDECVTVEGRENSRAVCPDCRRKTQL
jgi:ribosomal protein L37AE/L43A